MALVAYTHALDQYPAGVQDLPPPLALLSNRAAAYIALGRWEAALQDMRKAFCYPCHDTEGNVKRFTRYARCLLALAKVEGDEVAEVLRHMQDQLSLLEGSQGAFPTRTIREGAKVYHDLRRANRLMSVISAARENAQYDTVLRDLDELFDILRSNKREAPHEWWMMYTEALAWQGRTSEAQEMFDEKLSTTIVKGSPASDWLHALLSCGRGEFSKAVEYLEKLRLATGELPKQASRLLHKTYSIQTLWVKVDEALRVSDLSKLGANLSRIQQLSDIPIMAENTKLLSFYHQLILSMVCLTLVLRNR